MSKDITDRYQLIGSVARGELPRDEDIQHFAESTMNELLAWYGYGDKVIRHVDQSIGSGCSGPQPPPGRDDAEPQTPPPPPPAVRSKSRFLCSVTDASSSLDAHPPDLLSAGGQPVYESDRAGVGLLQKRSPPQSSSSGSSQRPSRDLHQFTRDAASSSQSLDSTQSLLRNNSCRPDSVNSLTSTDSTESNHIASTKVPTREAADYSQNHQRHPAAMTKLKKVCDWCRQVPASISLTDAVDGLNQLSFCSELCLNHYKMNLFCTETQQYLQQIQNSEEAGDLTVAAAAADNKILITPDLWMAEKREGKRARFNENQMEIRAADDNCYNRAAADDSADQREDDELCRRGSDCGSTVDTSNGMEFAEYLDLKKSKRKKDDRAAVLSSEISSEASLDVGKGAAEERFSDGESGRRGKRLKTSTSKEAVSPASYPAVASNLKKCLELPTDVSKESGGYLSPGSSSRARGRSGLPLLSQATSSDPSTDPTQFRRSSDASNTVERSKVEAAGVNCLGSRQGKPGSLHFPSSPLFGSSNHLPATSLFSPPGIPSLMHLLGPTFNPQFLGTGATVPPFPFLGFPSLLSMPGAGGASGGGSGGGVQNVPPVIPAPPPVTNPWSSLLPPNTLMIPYPVLLPLPIPIPIPFPVPAKCGLQQQKGETADSSSKRQCDSGKADTFKERPGPAAAGDPRGGLPLPAVPKGQDNRSESFPNHTIVCTCCRSGGDSLPGRRHSRSTFCSPCRNEGGGDGLGNHQATSFADSPGSVPSAPLFSPASAAAALASQNLAIDFSMARDSKSSSSLRSPSVQGASSYALTTPSSVSIKTEPLDLAISTENNNLSSSSPSSASSSLMMMKSSSSCEMHHCNLPPSLPYLARRSLILDAPSISKERPVAVEKHFADAASASSSSSKKFMYCKRRYPSLHIKTK